jgi:hypothetical protein
LGVADLLHFISHGKGPDPEQVNGRLNPHHRERRETPEQLTAPIPARTRSRQRDLQSEQQ